MYTRKINKIRKRRKNKEIKINLKKKYLHLNTHLCPIYLQIDIQRKYNK
jgi:hypothetical protein